MTLAQIADIDYLPICLTGFAAVAFCCAFSVPKAVAGTRKAILARRRRMNLCQSCGYSLRGNVSGICPECGTRVKAESTVH
jgi:hypothetical protein